MERIFAVAAVLALAGVALFVGPVVLIEPAESTYYVDARAIDAVPDDASVVPLDEVDASMRDDVRDAIGSSESVAVGHRHPSVPSYVGDDGEIYELGITIADPGGGGVVALASFGLGLCAFAGATVAAILGRRRRYGG